MRNIRYIIFIFLFSCSSSNISKYDLKFPFSENYAFSKDQKVSIQIPAGWDMPDEKQLPLNNNIQIYSGDSSAFLEISELKYHYSVREQLEKAGIEALGNLSYEMHKVELKKNLQKISEPQKITVNGKDCCEYLFTIDGSDTSRVIIFDSGKKYFECLARPLSLKLWDSYHLFSLQDAVLKTLAFK